jgi:hypothetical protein
MVNGNVDGARAQLTSNGTTLVVAALAMACPDIVHEAILTTKQESQGAMMLLHSEVTSLNRDHWLVTITCASLRHSIQ